MHDLASRLRRDFHIFLTYKNIYPIYPDNYRDKGNKVELIIIMEFVLTAHKVKVQISFQVEHKRTLSLEKVNNRFTLNYFIETGTLRFSHSRAKPFLSITYFNRSLKLADFSGFTVTRNTSFAGSSLVLSSSFTPH